MTPRALHPAAEDPAASTGLVLILQLAPVLLVAAGLTLKLLYFPVVASLDDESFRASWWLRRTPLATVGSLGTLLLLFSPLNFLRGRRRIPVLLVADVLLTLLIIADAVYLRYFGDVLSVAALTAAPQLPMISGSILALIRPTDALFFADLPLLLLFRRCTDIPLRLRWQFRRATFALMAGGVLMGMIPAAILAREGESDYFKLRGVAKVGLLNYHAYDLVRQLYLRATPSAISPSSLARVRAFFTKDRPTDSVHSKWFGVGRRDNVIMVMVEALHSFPLGLVVNGTEVTPHLNALARRSMTFANFYDQTWQGVTSDGEFTALQSLHPLAEGGVPTRLGSHRFVALPRILSQNGYSTVSAHGYSGAIWMMAAAHRSYGFQRSFFGESFDQTDRLEMGLSDASFFRQMVPRLASLPQPFMAFLVTLSTHFPYRLPPALRDSTLDVPKGTLLGGYLQSVHQLDRSLGEFLDDLAAHGLLDRSVLVLFGDHHAALGEPKDLGDLLSRYAGGPQHTPGFDPFYWQVEKRLPLIIHLPHDVGSGVRAGTAGHLDIAPTLLSLLGISTPRMVELGRDLTAGGSSLVVFRDGGFIVGDTACVVPSSNNSSIQCRDVRNGAQLSRDKVQGRFQQAQERLGISDILLTGDLIPWASQLINSQARSADTVALRRTAAPGQ